jgi:CheY-like chemotaxis protein
MARTLLVIDDNRSVRESLKFLLLRRGYVVLAAESGAEALAFAEKQPIDGALVDVNMPGMNGIEVCRILRERAAQSGHEISVWMMTGARSPEVLKLAREAGALDVLGKPFDLPSLYRQIERELVGRQDPDAAPEAEAAPSGK